MRREPGSADADRLERAHDGRSESHVGVIGLGGVCPGSAARRQASHHEEKTNSDGTTNAAMASYQERCHWFRRSWYT